MPTRVQGDPLVSEEAFLAAGQPGRGSAVGDFVPGKNGGWVPRDHPDAPAGLSNESGPPLTAAGSHGEQEGGPASAAISGLRAASSSALPGGGLPSITDVVAQSASNQNLGQRIYPTAMKQLAMLPRIY